MQRCGDNDESAATTTSVYGLSRIFTISRRARSTHTWRIALLSSIIAAVHPFLYYSRSVVDHLIIIITECYRSKSERTDGRSRGAQAYMSLKCVLSLSVFFCPSLLLVAPNDTHHHQFPPCRCFTPIIAESKRSSGHRSRILICTRYSLSQSSESLYEQLPDQAVRLRIIPRAHGETGKAKLNLTLSNL